MLCSPTTLSTPLPGLKLVTTPCEPDRFPMKTGAPARSKVARSFRASVPATGPLDMLPMFSVPDWIVVVPSRSLLAPDRSRVPGPNLVRPEVKILPLSVAMPLA